MEKGYLMTKEHKEKIGLAHKGRVFSAEHKRNIGLKSLGRFVSPETREKIRVKSTGRVCSNETREKIRQGNTGRKASCSTKLKLSESHKGIYPSKETRIKMSIAHEGKHFKVSARKKMSEATKLKISKSRFSKNNPMFGRSGILNPNWRGGVTPINIQIRSSAEYNLWENSVFVRDMYCCVKCLINLKPYRLVAHHIFNFSSYIELRLAIDNGITFCKLCHKRFHLIYGYKNNNREQLLEFLNNK